MGAGPVPTDPVSSAVSCTGRLPDVGEGCSVRNIRDIL